MVYYSVADTMRLLTLLALCALISCAYAATKPKSCGKNASWRYGTCDGKCESPKSVCRTKRHLGCFCNKQYMRNKKGNCVSTRQCITAAAGRASLQLPVSIHNTVRKCKRHEVWRLGTCDGTCQHPKRHCRVKIHWGCFCLRGQVRNKKGHCVPLKHCQCHKKVCPRNEVWRVGTCDGTCEQPNRMCRIKNHHACFCINGYVRNILGHCVPLNQCPQPCEPNEEWREGTCDGTCEEPNRLCRIMNHFACFCLPGYVRNSQGQCVPTDQCYPECKVNEYLNVCPGYCTFDPDCLRLVDGIVRDCAAPPNDYQCQPRCDCQPDLVRVGADCLPRSICCSGENVAVVNCPAQCDPDNYGNVQENCNCFTIACRCVPGFGRDLDGNCVPIVMPGGRAA